MSQLRDGEPQFCVHDLSDESDSSYGWEVFDCRAENQVDAFDTEEEAYILCEQLNALWEAADSPQDGISYIMVDGVPALADSCTHPTVTGYGPGSRCSICGLQLD